MQTDITFRYPLSSVVIVVENVSSYIILKYVGHFKPFVSLFKSVQFS